MISSTFSIPSFTDQYQSQKNQINDRYIPNRNNTNLELTNILLNSEQNDAQFDQMFIDSIYQNQYQPNTSKQKDYRFLNKANRQKPLYKNALEISPYKQKQQQNQNYQRIIPQEPEKVLDAPNVIDDYYLHQMDSSKNGILAIALATEVYLYNYSTQDSCLLFSIFSNENHQQIKICSLSWCINDVILAIGFSDKTIQIWDITAKKILRKLNGHQDRITSLSWNNNILTSGSKDSNIINHDIRVKYTQLSQYKFHTGDICGLTWSNDGTQLASGSEDNKICIWNMHSNNPLLTFDQHKAAVKGLAWCPYESNYLASGSGTGDKSIKFWSTDIGIMKQSIQHTSQISSLLWSKNTKELISSHGFNENNICLWKYPDMSKIGSVEGHSKRILDLVLSNDGETLISLSADETLRFWPLFNQKKEEKNKPLFLNSDNFYNIR